MDKQIVDEGRAAFGRLPRSANPYPATTGGYERSVDWAFGWDSAADRASHEAEYGPIRRDR